MPISVCNWNIDYSEMRGMAYIGKIIYILSVLDCVGISTNVILPVQPTE